MDTEEDKRRREETINEIRELGNNAVYFENLPSRPLREDSEKDVLDKCRNLVKGSDALIAIIDNTVSQGMNIELEEARKSLGENKIFYYFTKTKERDDTVKKLRENVKLRSILTEIETPTGLRREIRKTLASYAEDVLKSNKSKILTDELVDVQSGKDQIWSYKFEKGTITIATCTGTTGFYAGLFDREEYANRYKGDLFGDFNFDCEKRPAYTIKKVIPEEDDYYLVIRFEGGLFSSKASIHVKVEAKK
jgi:hypothetical protein